MEGLSKDEATLRRIDLSVVVIYAVCCKWVRAVTVQASHYPWLMITCNSPTGRGTLKLAAE